MSLATSTVHEYNVSSPPGQPLVGTRNSLDVADTVAEASARKTGFSSKTMTGVLKRTSFIIPWVLVFKLPWSYDCCAYFPTSKNVLFKGGSVILKGRSHKYENTLSDNFTVYNILHMVFKRGWWVGGGWVGAVSGPLGHPLSLDPGGCSLCLRTPDAMHVGVWLVLVRVNAGFIVLGH